MLSFKRILPFIREEKIVLTNVESYALKFVSDIALVW